MPQLSVVIATYNRRDLLLSLLENLAEQDLPATDFEVVVVDDGSKEPAAPHVKHLESRLQLTVLTQANTGQAGARDAGIARARGDIIVIVDDDMSLPRHFLRAHRDAHAKGNHVVLGHIRPDPELAHMPLFERFHAEQMDVMVSHMRKGIRPKGARLFTGNVSLRREHYLAVGGFDRSLIQAEDRDLGIRLERHGAKFAFSEDAYSVHHSDHVKLEVWLRRAFRYGICDSKIAAKYPEQRNVDPWEFFEHANLLAKPAFALAAVAPQLGHVLAQGAMFASDKLDQAGMERVALKGTTLAYGLEYFRGVREEAGSLARSFQGLRKYLRKAPSSSDAG